MGNPVTLDFSKAQPIQTPAAGGVQLDFSKAQPIAKSTAAAPRSPLDHLANDPNDIPLDSFTHATEHGFASIGKGVAQGVNAIAHPIDTLKAATDIGPKVMDFLSGSGEYNGENPVTSTARIAKNAYRHPLETGDFAGEQAGQILTGLGTDATLGKIGQVVRDTTPSKITAPVRAGIRGANKVLAKAPGAIGASAGAGLGAATHIPGAAEIGGGVGYAIGKEVLPTVRIPGEGVGLPKRVIGGPATAPSIGEEGLGLPSRVEGGPATVQRTHPSEGVGMPSRVIGGPVQAPSIGEEGVGLPSRVEGGPVKAPRIGENGIGRRVLGAELGDLPPTSAKPAAESGEALASIGKGKIASPSESAIALRSRTAGLKFHGEAPGAQVRSISSTKRSALDPVALEQSLSEGLGGRPLQPNVRLRDQLNVKTPAPIAKLPMGFTPVESSALRAYKYDPAKQEFEAITKDGGRYRRGEVSPEQFSKFERADSKGKAWKELSDNSTPLGKHVGGQYEPYQRRGLRSADPNRDLTPELEESVRHAKASKKPLG